MMPYKIPSGCGEAEYDEKRSRFLAYLKPVDTEDEAKSFIQEMKKKHYDARHNCWCYVIRGETERYSDDGEPQGTAGIPMLEMFRHEEINNFVCVVTRYFGGTLLGTGGLVRAYTKAASDALKDAGVSLVCRWEKSGFSCPYSMMERIKQEVSANGGVVSALDYGADVRFSVLVPEDSFEAFCAGVTDASNGSISVLSEGEDLIAVKLEGKDRSV